MKRTKWLLCVLLVCLVLPGAQAATYSFRNDPFVYDTPSASASTVTWHAGTDGTWLGSPACTSYPNGDDDWADVTFPTTPTPFVFVFGGITYSQVRIYSNGILAFGNDVSGFHRDYTPQALPITTAGTPGVQGTCTLSGVPANIMVVYWQDIVAGSARSVTGDAIRYEVLGSAPNRRMVITWSNVALYSTTTTRYTFQVVLFESAAGVNGPFEYRYTSGSSTGSGATVGVQLTTTDYTQYSYNQTFIDTVNGTNIHWYPQTTLASAAGVYHFDEASWNGSPGQVLDSSGNVPPSNGTSMGSANTVATSSCSSGRAGNFPANTSTTPPSAVNTTLVPGKTGSIDLWYYSNVKWNTANSQAMLFDASPAAGTPFYLMKTASGALQFTVSDSAGAISTTTSTAQTFAASTWHHIGATWDFLPGTNQTYIQIYLDGVLNNSARYTTTGTIATLGSLYIGDSRGLTPSGGTPNSANGYIDEVKVYTSQINGYQALTDMPCSALVDHFWIKSASTGLTCFSNPLTVVACQDAACTVNYTAGVTGTLTATGTGMTVNWDSSTGGATGAGFSMGSSGFVVKNVQVATAGSVTFGIASPNPVPTNSVVCNFGNNSPSNNNCVFTATKAGFVVTNSATSTAGYTIPAQVSGIATAANALYLRALTSETTPSPAVCTPALISTSANVTMSYTCNNPTTCQSGNLATVNSTSIPSSGSSVSLTFDANGSAPFTLRYDDVGQITLNAAVVPFTGGTAMTGSSNAFVVAPHHFGFAGIPSGPFKAGGNFAPAAAPYTTVTAYNGLATPTVTANFGGETTAEKVALSFAKCQPTGSNSSSGTFTGGVNAFSSGVANVNSLIWSDVGNGDLVATNSNYLGSALPATGNSGTGGTTCNTSGAGNVGRFIPDHFDVVVTGPLSCPSALSCPSGGAVYSGQPFAANVYARNAAGGTTQNYDGTVNTSPNFSKVVTLGAWTAAGGSTAVAGTTGAISSNTIAISAFNKGTTVSPGTPGAPVFTFAAPAPSANSGPTDIFIRATDTDSVTSLRSSNPTTTSVEGGVKVLGGRTRISSAYGSELLKLQLTATVQYWNGTAWVRNDGDSVTSFNSNLSSAGGNLVASILSGLNSGISVVSPGSAAFAAGTRTFWLAAPGVVGSADVSLNTPSYLPGVAGRVSFGVYNSKSGFIYRRESY